VAIGASEASKYPHLTLLGVAATLTAVLINTVSRMWT
jgi:hypothetical protein